MPLIIGDKPVDMICQFTRDCEIIPIKFRLEGKDGELQEYKILDRKSTRLNSSHRT